MLENTDFSCDYKDLKGMHLSYLKDDSPSYKIYKGTVNRVIVEFDEKTEVHLICNLSNIKDKSDNLNDISFNILNPNIYDNENSLHDAIKKYESNEKSEMRETINNLLDTIGNLIACTLTYPEDNISIEEMKKAIKCLRDIKGKIKNISENPESFMNIIHLLMNGSENYQIMEDEK